MVRLCLLLMLLHAPCASAGERQAPPDPQKGERSDAKTDPVRAGRVFLWVPRLVLMPIRYLWKGISYPVAAMANSEEKHHVSQKLYLMFTTSDGMLGVRPELDWSLSFTPTLGASFFDHKLFGRDTYYDATLRGGLGGDIAFTRMRARPFPSRWATQLDLQTVFNRRDDQLYTGIGIDHPLRPARYLVNDLEIQTLARFMVRPEVRFILGTSLGFKRFDNGREVSGDPPIVEVYCVRDAVGRCTGQVSDRLVPGFNEGTQFARGIAGFVLDTRDSVFKPTAGARLDLSLDYAHGFAGDASSYLRFTGAVMGVLDLWKRTHLLVVRAWGMTVAPFGSAPVPFSELVLLGGPDDLRGVRRQFLRDYSGVLFTAEYRWPIWMWMDASLFVDAGGVFGQAWSGFAVEKLVPDVGVALRVRTSKLFFFQLQTAWSPRDGVQVYIAFSAVP